MIKRLVNNINARRVAIVILTLAVIYLLSLLGYRLYLRRKGGGASSGGRDEDLGDSAASNSTGSAATTEGFPLRWGSRGDGVRRLQQTCLARGISVGITGVDGIWGRNTEAAVRQLKAVEYQYTDTAGSGTYRPYDPYIKPLSVAPAASGSQLEVRTPEDFNAIITA